MTRTGFPTDALTQHVAIVGKTGAGKTYAAKGLVEQLLDAQRRVVTMSTSDESRTGLHRQQRTGPTRQRLLTAPRQFRDGR